MNVQTSKQRVKNLAADRRGPLATGAPSHGTTGTMDNPALRLEAMKWISGQCRSQYLEIAGARGWWRATSGVRGRVPGRMSDMTKPSQAENILKWYKMMLALFSTIELLAILFNTVASLGWVTPGAATEGVTPLFFLKNLATFFSRQFCGVTPGFFFSKTDDLFAHRCHYHYRFLLLSLGCHLPRGCHPTPFFTCPTSFLHYSL